MLRTSETESFSDLRPKFNLAAVCLGLSVSAALAFAAPAVALAAVFLVWGRGWIWLQGAVADWLSCCRFVLTAFVLLILPLNTAEWKTLAVGATSLRQTINELSYLTFRSSSKVLAAASRVFVGMLAAMAVVSAGKWWRSGPPLVVLAGGSLALSLTFLLTAHAWKQIPFPEAGAIYLIPLSTLVVSGILFKWNHKAAQIVLLGWNLLAARYLSELPIGMYQGGKQFTGGRALAKALRTAVRPGRSTSTPASRPNPS